MNKFFSFFVFFIFIFFLYVFIFLNNSKIYQQDNIIAINKGTSLLNIVDLILPENNYINKKIYYFYIRVLNKFSKKIKYGEFQINKNLNLIQITKIISNTSNVYKEFKIIGGWEMYNLNQLIKKKFNTPYTFLYNDVIADTYKYQSHNTVEEVYDLIKETKNNYFYKFKDNELFNNYTIEEIMIIASLVEKEGKTVHDKRIISSVIFNRLNKKMKLQIDATTIFSITKGKFKFNRKLLYKDLEIEDLYNTYFIKGLPQSPICYVSRKTIEIVMENYKSNYLFYFFNENKQAHVFSETYKEHMELLNEYRKSK